MNTPALNRHQKRYLRALRTGDTSIRWPRRCVVERWMQQPTFRRKVEELLDYQDFIEEVSHRAAACLANRMLGEALAAGDAELTTALIRTIRQTRKR